jgi:MerR family transcriptional regulator, redox-sensitive transcriptional activator SoxR
METTLSIGEVARASGIATSAMRYYESIGLIAAPARKSGQRRYDASVIKTIGFIHLAQHAGFTMLEIQTLLHGFPTQTPPSARWKQLAEHKLLDIQDQLERILEMKRTLEEGLKCGCLTISECSPICTSTPALARNSSRMLR